MKHSSPTLLIEIVETSMHLDQLWNAHVKECRRLEMNEELLDKLKTVESYLFNEVLCLEAAYGENFKPYKTEAARKAWNSVREVIYSMERV